MAVPRIPRNFTLTSYTNNTWTDVVRSRTNLQTIIISNTTAGAINVSVRIGGPDAVVLPTTSVAANSSYVMDLNSLTIESEQALQVYVSATGVHVIASEVY